MEFCTRGINLQNLKQWDRTELVQQLGLAYHDAGLDALGFNVNHFCPRMAIEYDRELFY
jgi:hypothetical protein